MNVLTFIRALSSTFKALAPQRQLYGIARCGGLVGGHQDLCCYRGKLGGHFALITALDTIESRPDDPIFQSKIGSHFGLSGLNDLSPFYQQFLPGMTGSGIRAFSWKFRNFFVRNNPEGRCW